MYIVYSINYLNPQHYKIIQAYPKPKLPKNIIKQKSKSDLNSAVLHTVFNNECGITVPKHMLCKPNIHCMFL